MRQPTRCQHYYSAPAVPTTCDHRFGLPSSVVPSGLSKKDQDRVKLHCTVMNASFLVRNMDESSPEYQKLRGATFDASAILKVLGGAGVRGGSLDRVVWRVERRGLVFLSRGTEDCDQLLSRELCFEG